MKIFLFLIVAFSCFNSFGQKTQKPQWTVTNTELAVLKKEKNIKLIVCLDSFKIYNSPTAEFVNSNVSAWKTLLKAAFVDKLNDAFNKKTNFSTSLTDSSYNYILRVTPFKYYVTNNNEVNESGQSYQAAPCFVEELYGNYRFEILDNTGKKCLTTINLIKMKNTAYIVNTCLMKKQTVINEDIYANMEKTGTMFGEYLLLLISSSRK